MGTTIACAVLVAGITATGTTSTATGTESGRVGSIARQVGANDLGLFEDQSDIGAVTPPGTGRYSAPDDAYTLTSAGSNTWYHVDNFHYLWKQASGDLTLTADVTFPPRSYSHEPNPHRKGILMFRQTLDAGGVYAGVGVHGSGMTALQYRRKLGANSEDIELNIDAPRTVRLEKRGDTFTLFLSMQGEPLHQVGASITLHLEEPFYVGLGAVSHDVSTTDEVRFSKVIVQGLPAEPSAAPGVAGARGVPRASGPPALRAAPPIAKVSLYSTLRTIQTEDQFRRAMVIRSVPGYMQSPNWASDGKNIYAYEAGHIERIPFLTPEAGGTPQTVNVGSLVDCSGNFGLSPDRKWLAVSCAETRGGRHDVYVLPAGGDSGADAISSNGVPAVPRKITQGTPSSFFHAWSPDSQTIAFTRGSAGKADIFTIALTRGTEVRLTNDTVNDGPDYSSDGKLIYFDSARSGSTQIWRMNSDGSEAEQVTAGDNINSSPHVSPDGKTVAFLSQPAAGGGVGIGDAELKVFSVNDGLIRTLTSFQGDRGSFSMYGWGDANHVAFVSYQYLPTAVEGPVLARPPITGVSHIALYAASPVKSERFYVHDLGAMKGSDPETPGGARYYFGPTQFVEVLPLPAGNTAENTSINRLDHVAFTTTDAKALRAYLSAHHVTVPAKLETSRDGSQWFAVTDPEGNKIEFIQPPTNPPAVPVNTLSSHIIHVGFIVHDRAREDSFFRTVLGFRPYWYGGNEDDKPTWISQQVPDGTDWLEYMIVGTPDGRGIPADMKASDLGVLDHFSLGVPNTEVAYTLLWNGGRLDGQTNTPKIGRDAKWQLNLLDPDGTRAEMMELHAIGTPCCSPFTATDPRN